MTPFLFGYLGFNGDMDVAIALRTAVLKDGTLYVQAGGGVVADSVPPPNGRKHGARPRRCCALRKSLKPVSTAGLKDFKPRRGGDVENSDGLQTHLEIIGALFASGPKMSAAHLAARLSS